MKQSKQTAQSLTKTPYRSGKPVRPARSRFEMNRFLRRLLILVLLILMAACLLAGYAVLFPLTFIAPVPVYNCQSSGDVQYEIQLKPNDFTEQDTMGMGQTYLRDFTDTIRGVFRYSFHSGQAERLQYLYRIDATVRALDAANPSQVLLTRSINLQPEVMGETEGSNLDLTGEIEAVIDDYDDYVADFRQTTSQEAIFDLTITMSVRVIAVLPYGQFEVKASPALSMPLDQPTFKVTRSLPAGQPLLSFMPVRFRLVLDGMPFPVFPAMAGICLLTLLVLAIMTCSRRKSRFNRRLKRMLRKARSRLMIIGDKAWEPEWCVTATDFGTLVRTAKKLKHPIFCFVDRSSVVPAAYFYIYYGENNYCFTFRESAANQPGPDQNDGLPEFPDEYDSSGPADSDIDDSIPLLPETDDSADLLLTSLKTGTGMAH